MTRTSTASRIERVRPPSEGLDFGRDGEAHGPFSATTGLLGDGSIRLISTPGHTLGHMSVLLQAAGGREVLVVGDAAYMLRSVRVERLSLLPRDDDTCPRSLREIKTCCEQNPDAIVIPTHDPTVWRQLR
jgi:glyoxylase-like metal-dependent hydrolase (beta-lactamase superfamily II)